MSVEELALVCIPVIFGALLLCLCAGKSPVYARNGSAGHGPPLVLLLALPIFLYGFILVAMRPLDAGNDTIGYISTYNQLDDIAGAWRVGALVYGNTEILWWPLQSVLRHFLSPRAWLIANYIFVFVLAALLYGKAARPSGVHSGIFALAFLTFFLVYTGNIMRQALATPIGALGLLLFFERRFLRASLLIAVAIGLHWSSIIFLAAPIFALRMFDRNGIYLGLPILALAASTLSSSIIGHIVDLLAVPGISDKFTLYFLLGRQSHIEAIWKTANFWICIVSSAAFLLIDRPSRSASRALHKFTLLLLSLVLFGINSADFSERYMPYLLLILPLQAALVAMRLGVPQAVKNFAFIGLFLLIGTLVLLAKSSQHTLGYSL